LLKVPGPRPFAELIAGVHHWVHSGLAPLAQGEVLTCADEFDHTPAQPTALRSATWNTYDVPGVSPVTVADVAAGLPVTDVYPGSQVAPPSVERLTTYSRIGEPPSLGADHDTPIDVAVAFDVETVPVTGDGTVARGRVAADADDGDQMPAQPTALRSATWNT